MAVNWIEVGSIATAISALATSAAAAFTANMARRTRQAVQQTKHLIDAANTQAHASTTQADAAQKQVALAEDQVRATQIAMVAMHTPVLAPAFLGGLAELRSLGSGGLSVTLPGGEIVDLRFDSIDASGHVQSLIRRDRQRPELVFVFCLRNVGLGPAVVEDARLLISQKDQIVLDVKGLADDVPAVDKRVLISFRSAEVRRLAQARHVALVRALASPATQIIMSITYKSPSSKQRRLTIASYKYKITSSDPFDLVGTMLMGSFETQDVEVPPATAAPARSPRRAPSADCHD